MFYLDLFLLLIVDTIKYFNMGGKINPNYLSLVSFYTIMIDFQAYLMKKLQFVPFDYKSSCVLLINKKDLLSQTTNFNKDYCGIYY